METLNMGRNSNMNPNLRSLRFMRGFSAAKTFLLSLTEVKQQEVDKKPVNSLAFSPIPEYSSRISQRPSAKSPKPFERQQSKKELTVDTLKNHINTQARHLNESYSELVYIESAVEVLAEYLRAHEHKFKQIERYKADDREKNIQLLALKSSVAHKKAQFQQIVERREAFRELVKAGIKEHLITQQVTFDCAPVMTFSKNMLSHEANNLLEESEVEEYPSRLDLKFRFTKRRDKEKDRQRKREEIPSQPLILKDKQQKTKGLIDKINKLTLNAETYYDSEYLD